MFFFIFLVLNSGIWHPCVWWDKRVHMIYCKLTLLDSVCAEMSTIKLSLWLAAATLLERNLHYFVFLFLVFGCCGQESCSSTSWHLLVFVMETFRFRILPPKLSMYQKKCCENSFLDALSFLLKDKLTVRKWKLLLVELLLSWE